MSACPWGGPLLAVSLQRPRETRDSTSRIPCAPTCEGLIESGERCTREV